LKEGFSANYTFGEEQKLDYQVRDNAQTFFKKFCIHQLNSEKSVENKTWLHEFYLNDETIKNIISNFNIIHQLLDRYELDEIAFYKYLENYTEFWYFDTNISEQGEELYIYMNARGEHVQSNENIKADLLSDLDSDSLKNSFGKKWEDWQDFFWQHRGKNENADKGFNEFLSCLSGLQNYLKGEAKYYYSKTDFEELGSIRTRQILKTLSITDIEQYIKVLKFLENYKNHFCSGYDYCDWVDESLNEIWSILNSKEKTNWYANYNDENRGAERNRMVFLWGILIFLSQSIHLPDDDDIDELQISENFRFLRMFYLRFKNYNRSVKSLKETIDYIINDPLGVLDPSDNMLQLDIENDVTEDNVDKNIRNYEEIKKNKLLNRYHGELGLQKKFEAIIWEIEDHPFNLNGRDVGGTNIVHLIDLDQVENLRDLENLKDTFYILFPLSKKNYSLLQNVLLFYGAYWHVESPYYYRNLRFDNWRRIIRGYGYSQDNPSGKNAFRNFLKEFLSFNGNLQELHNHKKQKADIGNVKSMRGKLLWYSIKLNEKMWSEGNGIAISNGSPCSLPDWESKDPQFSEEYIIYNTKGNLKGGNPQKLNDKL
jgi:hypothetical protein